MANRLTFLLLYGIILFIIMDFYGFLRISDASLEKERITEYVRKGLKENI